MAPAPPDISAPPSKVARNTPTDGSPRAAMIMAAAVVASKSDMTRGLVSWTYATALDRELRVTRCAVGAERPERTTSVTAADHVAAGAGVRSSWPSGGFDIDTEQPPTPHARLLHPR